MAERAKTEKQGRKAERNERKKRRKEGVSDEVRRRAPVYAAVSALLSLIGVFGLLIGYYTGGSPVGYALAGGAPVLRGSLLGAVLEILRGSIPMPEIAAASSLAQILPLFLYFAAIFLSASLALCFFLTIGAILLPNSSRKLCLRIGKLLLLSYSALFFGNFIFRALSYPQIEAEFFDLPSALAAGLTLLVLVLISLSENGGRGALNFLLLLLSLCPALALCLPSSPLSKDVNELIFSNGAHGGAARLTLLILCGVTLVNLLFSLLRLNVRRGYFFDFLRFGAQIACEVLLLLRYGSVYASLLQFFTVQPLPAALLLISPLLALTVSLFAGSLAGRGARAEREKRRAAKKQRETERARRIPAPDFDEQPSSRGAV